MHPIVAQMSPSDEQRPAILARDRDVVVTAGAGTGKTRTLVARYLSLLAEGLPLRRIVAITFTRKAAREMRNRVRDEVRRYLEHLDLTDDERGQWLDIYTALDAARIGTIHSLCVEILRAHPAEAKVDPRFEVLDEGQANVLNCRAVDEAMAWAADDDQAVALFGLLGERDLRRTLETLMAHQLDVQDTFDTLPPDVLGHWKQTLEKRQGTILRALFADPTWRDAVTTLRQNVPDDPDDRMAIQRRIALAAIDGTRGLLSDRLTSLAHLDQINLSGGRQNAWPGGKTQTKAVKDALRTLRSLWREQSDLLELTLTSLDGALAEAIPVLCTAFDVAQRRYDVFKRERNALDFDDLEGGALALLKNHAAVQAHWQEEIQAILVDEFQDTNGRQRDLVTLLNGEGGKLFVVGDAKQSIYRFRGADVTVFRDERERIERNGGAAYRLETSYRAHRVLVQGLNDLLRPVLGEEIASLRPWAEPFAPLKPHRQQPGLGFEPPYIELHLTVGSKSDGARDRAADVLVERIVELVGSGAQVVKDGKPRALEYGDVAILCRASSSFAAYEDALERAGMPFLTVAGRGFYGRPEIRDLLNALRALADPTDDLALVGLLRSPAMGLSDEALYRLCRERDQADEHFSLWDVLRSGMALTGEDAERADRAVCIIADLHNQAGRTAVADLLKALLDATDYRAALIQSGQRRGARNVAKLLSDAHASGIVSVGEFVEYVDTLRDAGAREGEARATAEGAVQVMTVHAAKGMEFPVVAIGDVTYEGSNRSPTLIDPKLGVLLPVKDEDDERAAIYQLGKAREDDQDDAESDRLLYVAATRARELLLLNGCVKLTSKGKPSRRRIGWLEKLSGPDGLGLMGTKIPHDEEGAEKRHIDGLQVGATPVACFVYEPDYAWKRRPSGAKAKATAPTPLPPPLMAPVTTGEEHVDERTKEQERRPPRRVWRVVPATEKPWAPSWVVGSLVHEALAAWHFPDESLDQWAEARARGCGLTDPRQLANAVSRSRRLLFCFRNHCLFEEMNKADRRLHEVPYSIIIDGRLESGIIDVLYFSRQESWKLVEFKTDDLRNESQLRKRVEEYIPQVRRYTQAIESLLGQEPRAMLCFLDYKGRVRIVHCNPQGGSK